DGSQEWEIELLSPNGFARWDQAFHFYDTGKPDHTWFGSRSGGGFNINYTNVWTYWRHRRGPADLRLAAAFDKISYVVGSSACEPNLPTWSDFLDGSCSKSPLKNPPITSESAARQRIVTAAETQAARPSPPGEPKPHYSPKTEESYVHWNQAI